ncbi:hypothetical protein BpHYR1_042579 [Brachionus plicatilis]|uniref:Uncharacterized protein n=1 Tax=Brachionus plicatilis TaxID=10195 RepID=A0A3M7SBA9_BRAPC|nr:hypothetical protein BpHYR1_042579 [Brachionus plicatilis]
MPVQSSMASLSSRRVSATNACPGSIRLFDTRWHTNICESPSSRALSLSRVFNEYRLFTTLGTEKKISSLTRASCTTKHSWNSFV